jgi:hypothetical protein
LIVVKKNCSRSPSSPPRRRRKRHSARSKSRGAAIEKKIRRRPVGDWIFEKAMASAAEPALLADLRDLDVRIASAHQDVAIAREKDLETHVATEKLWEHSADLGV